MKTEIKIESGVPMPTGKSWSRFAAMQVGDSFVGTRREYGAAYNWGRHQEPRRRFRRKSIDGVMRIWRVE